MEEGAFGVVQKRGAPSLTVLFGGQSGEPGEVEEEKAEGQHERKGRPNGAEEKEGPPRLR